ncbi:MAG: hypothetical protein R3F59_29600 [Myxococcota bacterium]
MIVASCRDVSEHMERLGDDEPPLPLGGDIVANPGWRTAAQPAPAEAAAPMVFTVVVGEPALPVDELSRRVERELRRALGPQSGPPTDPGPFTDDGGSV